MRFEVQMLWPLAALIAALLAIGLAMLWARRHSAALQRDWLQQAQRERQLTETQTTQRERERLYADLHDDIGAKLVTLIHALDAPEQREQADLARTVMQDLRDIVSRSQAGPLSLLETLAQIREETEQRLDLVHCALDWQQDELPDPMLEESQVLHLFRISREAITNALRHAHAKRLRVRLRSAKDVLLLDFTDDGPGPAPAQSGRGTDNMRQRAEALHGDIQWTPGTQGGTKVVLQFPLGSAGSA